MRGAFPPSLARRAFTLIEMLTTVALLVIVLGLMVSVARHVRERSSQALTESLLRQLDAMMSQYANRNSGQLPAVPPFPPPDARPPESAFPLTLPAAPASQASMPPTANDRTAEARRGSQRPLLLQAALANNQALVTAMQEDSAATKSALAALPVSISDANQIRDAWGSPVVFMPQSHPWVGTAPRDKAWFFFSAGPDRDYLTRDDNLYSYEEIVGGDRRSPQ